MRDIFYTLVVIWLIYRIWNAFASKPKPANTATDFSSRKEEGEVTIEKMDKSKPPKNESGDYVDYTEVKD